MEIDWADFRGMWWNWENPVSFRSGEQDSQEGPEEVEKIRL
jgi:hypothetical protein